MAETQPMMLDDNVEGSLTDSSDQTNSEANKNKSFLTLGFYQYYFNVSTATVLHRIRRVFLFRPNAAFSLLDLEPFPDMCGPVWIFITIWLASVMCSDIGDRFTDPMIRQDFSRIAIGLCIVFANAVLSLVGIFVATIGQRIVPIGFPSGTSQSAGNAAHILSLYGYSLAPFVPGVLLCILPWPAARWVFLIVAAVFTSLFLAHDMWFIIPNKVRFLCVSVYLLCIQIAFCAALQYLVMGHTVSFSSSSNDLPIETTSLALNLTTTRILKGNSTA